MSLYSATESGAGEPDYEPAGVISAMPRRMRLSLYLILLALPQLVAAKLTPSPQVHDFCADSFLAEKRDSDFCEASVYARLNGATHRVCIPRPVWRKWLYHSTGSALCGAWTGNWKTRLPRRNCPDSHPRSEEVKPEFIFRIKEFKAGLPENNNNLRFIFKEIEKIRERASDRLAPFDGFGIARQLLLNEKPESGESQILRLSGFVHLLTATGIHLYALGDWTGFAVSRAARVVRIPVGAGLWISRGLSFGVWGFAWLLSGMRAGMLRPWIVVSARSVSGSLGFRWRKWTPLFFALGLDLTVAAARHLWGDTNAWAPGRWIYALAVGGGLSVSGENGSPLKKHAALAIASWVYVAIVEIYERGFVAFATPVLSLATLPLFSLILYPALLASVLLDLGGLSALSPMLLRVAGGLSSLSIEFLFGLTQSVRSIWLIQPMALVCGTVLSTLLGSYLYKRSFPVILILALILVIAVREPWATAPYRREQWASRVEQLDVGQGDSVLLRTSSGATGFIDTGGKYGISSGGWFELLARRGITRVDFIAFTHLDEDHSGGLQTLSRLVPIGCVAASPAAWASPHGQSILRDLSRQGIRAAVFDGSCFPFASLSLVSGRKRNTTMTGFRVPIRGGGYYFNGGDSTAPLERVFARWLGGFTKESSGERILKVSHHGSKTGTTPLLLQTIRPTQAWISVGLDNSFGHPASPILEKLEALRIPIRRTDREGVLILHPQYLHLLY